ncbi:hypothetical protein BG844_12425 [Couchioplanes caeruleus subsp. caeruleus]|uniref:DUF308 domain-containing protein n=2 Tax=Couchioplanes caeruleus TaxID=56438 RepID=A0A1K0G9R5_9ACTN|nr:hypothetical protein BG844_12425 [Couchioplanes caeruleus subsp. caeruleus]
MWGFLLLAGVAWLAIAWSVLRLEPADIADVAGPVVLFAAVTEAVRALAGTRTWWLNAGMALLFVATGVVLMSDGNDTWTTPAALIGWYLMVRGAADLAISMMTRETDRIWGLLTVVGLAELGLGFFAAGSFARTAEMVAVILGGAALIRGVADLVASLRLREVSVSARAGRLLELPAERAVGVAGYSAGMTDFEEGPTQASRARHRAMPQTSAGGTHDLSGPRPGQAAALADLSTPGPTGARTGSFHDEVLRTTADLDAMLALAGVTGAAVPGAAAQAAEAEQVEVPDTAEGAELPPDSPSAQQPARPEITGRHGRPGDATAHTTAPATGSHAAGTGSPGNAGSSVGAPGNAASNFGTPRNAASNFSTPANAASNLGTTATGRQKPPGEEGPLPLLDPTAQAARAAMPGMDDTSIITRGRLVD